MCGNMYNNNGPILTDRMWLQGKAPGRGAHLLACLEFIILYVYIYIYYVTNIMYTILHNIGVYCYIYI